MANEHLSLFGFKTYGTLHSQVLEIWTDPSEAGLAPYWPYCNAAQRLRSVAMTPHDVENWNSLQWRRRLERFGEDDGPVVATGAGGEVDGIWLDC